MSGIEDALYRTYEDVTIRVEYLDSKNISSDMYFNEFHKMLVLKYADQDINAIVCADDHAFSLLLRYRDVLFKEVPIFFCGINALDGQRFVNQK